MSGRMRLPRLAAGQGRRGACPGAGSRAAGKHPADRGTDSAHGGGGKLLDALERISAPDSIQAHLAVGAAAVCRICSRSAGCLPAARDPAPDTAHGVLGRRPYSYIAFAPDILTLITGIACVPGQPAPVANAEADFCHFQVPASVRVSARSYKVSSFRPLAAFSSGRLVATPMIVV